MSASPIAPSTIFQVLMPKNVGTMRTVAMRSDTASPTTMLRMTAIPRKMSRRGWIPAEIMA